MANKGFGCGNDCWSRGSMVVCGWSIGQGGTTTVGGVGLQAVGGATTAMAEARVRYDSRKQRRRCCALVGKKEWATTVRAEARVRYGSRKEGGSDGGGAEDGATTTEEGRKIGGQWISATTCAVVEEER
ncbi:hypothetical protein BHM03_00051289 [Ensete ventricosum]|uniref:Uncharacterized protein n=1 Tax=Ensete ventricosum TaxID=4639 RepID=A0A445MLM1_ENSVE|nr:hypothetical protein BHM03_00051289 [Ensete ventricosum]